VARAKWPLYSRERCEMTPTGLETGAQSNVNSSPAGSAREGLAIFSPRAASQLDTVAECWPRLAPAVRAEIVAIALAADNQGAGR
jgi:hypothetical protein